VIAETEGRRWRWDHEPCCPFEWLPEKVHREVWQMEEPWVFVARIDGPRETWRTVDLPDGTAEHVPVIDDPGWLLPWYAEARGRGVARVTGGVLEMEHWRPLGEQALADRSAFRRAARRVLSRHPDRARHRLR
jgi:hypothetical protein